MRQKKANIGPVLLLPAVLAAVLIFLCALSNLSDARRSEGREQLEEAVRRSAVGGTLSRGVLNVYYDENWEQAETESDCAYLLRTEALPAAVTGLCQADVRVEPAGGTDPLFALTVAWQEVIVHE